MDDSGDEEEQDEIITKVLDEIGIEITGKVSFLLNTHFIPFFLINQNHFNTFFSILLFYEIFSKLKNYFSVNFIEISTHYSMITFLY